MNLDPTRRFSGRVENYVKFRPGYPGEVLEILRESHGLTAGAVVADIGSGTGLLSGLFLENGNRVYGVEPNERMRAAGELLLSSYPNFTSVAGSAEATTLPDASVDWVTAGQAFHWFEPEPTRAEFRRILRPGGLVALVWNERGARKSPFMKAYEGMLQGHGIGYGMVKQTNSYRDIEEFLAGGFYLHQIDNEQIFDFASLKGRLQSSSYAPMPGQPGFELLMGDLRRLFDEHADEGRVRFLYDCRVFVGRIE